MHTIEYHNIICYYMTYVTACEMACRLADMHKQKYIYSENHSTIQNMKLNIPHVKRTVKFNAISRNFAFCTAPVNSVTFPIFIKRIYEE